MKTDTNPGVSAMSIYVPRLRVPLEAWSQWTGNPWDKIRSVVGRSFRYPARHENVYTMAANAVLRLIRNNDIDPGSIGFLALGTESSKDNSAGAVIVRGMVDRALDQFGLPRLSRNLEVPEFKHACLGGVYALKGALRYASCDARGKNAIVVCSDIAEYERGSSGEQTQGAGAVALLVNEHPELFSIDLTHTGSASDYRGPDFRKPFARHFVEGYTSGVSRMHDFPVFSGKYSTFAYLDEAGQAVDEMLRRLDVHGRDFVRDVKAMFFHRPYHLMPVQGLAFLYVRALAKSRNAGELNALCEEIGVNADAVRAEAQSKPDLFETVMDGNKNPPEPYPATTQLAAHVRKSAVFKELIQNKMSLGTDRAMDLGNLYTAALPGWLAAGFEEAAETNLDLENQTILAVGYGSGDAAESIPLQVVPGWSAPARRIGFREALADPVDLTKEQYEALHDGRDIKGLNYKPKDEFIIARVGEVHEPAFQDLGIEYYEYVA
ncbi:MAG TPA: hydroxymethylglutaryl-CoA synthase [Polyangiaceae bacterium]